MLDKVLFPTDFSEVSESILEWLPSLNCLGIEELVLVRVINLNKVVGVASGFNVDTWIKSEEEEGRKKLVEWVNWLKEQGINAGFVTPIPRGDPVWEIVKTAEDENASFIVIGSKGKGILKETLLGSVSEGVVRRSKVPVMLVKPKYFKKENGSLDCDMNRKPFDKILFAYDFSEYSRSIIEYVKHAAISGGKEVVVVNVKEDAEHEDKDREELMASARKELESQDIRVKTVMKKGKPHKEIIKTAKEENASMIMMNSRGLGFMGAVLGSTTDSVVRHSEVPVYVFKN
ncbi:MAG: universal stress protein [Archaeoglobaceae archaeon]